MLETTVAIRNVSQKTLKFTQCELVVAFVTNTAEDVKIGTIRQDVILLEPKDHLSSTDTDFVFALNLGSKDDVVTLSEKTRATTEVLLQESKPKINLHLQARFNLAIKVDKGWNELNEVEIDWIVTPEIEKAELGNFLQAITNVK